MSELVAASVAAGGGPQPGVVRTPRRRRMADVVLRLTMVNILGSATGFITGPLLARALGPSGRGDLAAIVVPLVLIGPILGFGITSYPFRTIPRGRAVGEVLGSLGLPLLIVGLIAASVAVPVADLLAHGRSTVRLFLIIGFLSAPLYLLGNLLWSTLSALQRWRSVMLTGLTPYLVALCGITTMFIVGDLTVETAAAITMAGSLLALGPGLPLLFRNRLSFNRELSRAGIGFGVRAWLGGLALTANARLDQLLMIAFVTPRELGLYAVATTLAGASGQVAGALTPPLMSRIAAGELHLMPQAVRIIVEATICINVGLALVTPLILTVLFGSRFDAAIPMALILLVAQVPLCGAGVLSSALQADGAPMIPTTAEIIAVVVTIAGLAALLGPLQAIGAAIVSLAAYSTSFLYQVRKAHRRIGVPFSHFVVPRREDARWALRRLGDLTSRFRAQVSAA